MKYISVVVFCGSKGLESCYVIAKILANREPDGIILTNVRKHATEFNNELDAKQSGELAIIQYRDIGIFQQYYQAKVLVFPAN